jgi:hypothetical protein
MKFTHFIPDSKAKISVFPSVSRAEVPQWYKDAESVIKHGDHEQPGLKKCIPFLDVLMSGYFLKTSTNIYIKKDDNGNISISYDDDVDEVQFLISERTGTIGSTVPRPLGHMHNHFIWTPVWGWKTPKGYSSLVTHPINRFDLPFTTISGVIDSDKFIAAGNLPFFLKEDFEGLIPKGTPFAQIIPIKRKKWFAVTDPALTSFAEQDSVINGIFGSYKKKLWEKKDYRIGKSE